MKTVGIIAEYNPFHNGHAYHIEKTKREADADYCVVVMSGDFVQRGEPACLDKYTRTRSCLENGADLVLELPFSYAAANAEFFAEGAVSILDGIGIIDTLSFGSESGDLALLCDLASLLKDESAGFSALLNKYMKEGLSYPSAREKALMEEFGDKLPEGFLQKPNNILALEYLKALSRRNSEIRPFTIPRIGDYHASEAGEHFSSATSLRKLIRESRKSEVLAPFVPEKALSVMQKDWNPVFPSDFSAMLGYALLSKRNGNLTAYADVSGELEGRIKKSLTSYGGFEEFADTLKTKQFTRARINRALLHILTDTLEAEQAGLKEAGFPSYARILGFRRDAGPLLTELKKKSAIPVITKMADADAILDPVRKRMLEKDIFAADLYRASVVSVYGEDASPKNEFTRGIVIV